MTIIASICVTSNARKRESGALFLKAAWIHPAYCLQTKGLFLIM